MSVMSNIDATLQELSSNGRLYVWYVVGDARVDLWLTKMDAEKHARELFPHEPPDACCARVMVKRAMTYEG